MERIVTKEEEDNRAMIRRVLLALEVSRVFFYKYAGQAFVPIYSYILVAS